MSVLMHMHIAVEVWCQSESQTYCSSGYWAHTIVEGPITWASPCDEKDMGAGVNKG